MAAAHKDFLDPKQGRSWSHSFTYYGSDGLAVDLTGYSALMKVKAVPGGSTILTSASTITITLGGSAGTIALSVTAANMAGLTPGCYLHEIELTSGAGTTTDLIEGEFWVNPEINA